MGRIKEIEFSMLRSEPYGFHNRKLAVRMIVNEEEDPEEIFKQAKNWVTQRIDTEISGFTEKKEELRKEIIVLDGQKADLIEEVKALLKTKETIQKQP